MDENEISYDEAKRVAGQDGKAGVSEAQLAINGVKSSVTQMRNGQAAADEAKQIVLRGMDTFPGRGNNRNFISLNMLGEKAGTEQLQTFKRLTVLIIM